MIMGMKMHLVTKNFVHSLYGFFFFELISIFSFLSAQIPENVYKSDYHISPESVGQLFVSIDNLNFFKDNEFSGSYMKGYTLPGFWFQGKAVYYPLKNLKFEAGVHLLRYWGANKYPNMIRQFSPITVFPFEAVPLLTVVHSRIVVLSPISAVVLSPLNFRS